MKDIKNYEGLYAITKDGKVWSYRQNKFLKLQINQKGYLRICLHNNNDNKTYGVHYLVAQTYIPNPENKSQVHHINGIKTDNRVENLMWATSEEHNIIHNNMKKVCCVETGIIYDNLHAAARATNIRYYSIGYVCKGKAKTAGKYHWKYVD